MYGAEIWGWDERKELEKIMMDYIRWVFLFVLLHSEVSDNEGIRFRS